MEGCKDVVFKNATVWAGNPIRKVKGGMKIAGGRVVEIFENGQPPWETDQSIDLKGMHVIPGLIDAHRHFSAYALLACYGDAGTWRSKADALAAIEAACSASRSPDAWVFFSMMDYSKWKKPCPPSLKEIDEVAQGRPVVVVDITFHRGIVSSEAIRKVGLGRNTLRHAGDVEASFSGKPKGIIWEEALGKVLFSVFRDMLKILSREEKIKLFLDEAKKCLAMGLTHVHDPGIPSDIQMLLNDAQGSTPLKMSWSITGSESLCSPPAGGNEQGAVHSIHAPKSVKFFLDGAHRTAASMPVIAGLKAMVRAAADSVSMLDTRSLRLLFEQKIILRGSRLTMPYLRFPDTGDLIRRAAYFSDKGYRLVLHALGNDAVQQAATVLNTIKPAGGASVEHLLVMSDNDLDIFAGCDAVASVQPGFIPVYADTLERQGVISYMKTFGLRSMIRRGIPICISSDGPCGPDDPLFNIRRAVDRRKPDGSRLDPEESISPEEALAAATIGGSLSMGNGNEGLKTGGPAHFCIVSDDPFSDSSRVVQTWIDGVRAY